MKPITLLAITVCLFTACQQKPKANSAKQPYELVINQDQIPTVSDITSPYQIETFRGITVPITLMNNSNDTLKYVNMSCSSDEIFSTNTDRVVLFRHGCEKNVLEVHSVPPHQSENIRIVLVVGKRSKGKERIRVGMCLVLVKKNNSWPSFEDISQHRGETIWSNKVQIP